ncbi:uncharacterized protein LOC128777792 [Panthera pardus]|uniref:Uncharacterized protein LOC128777792 n=1 Tax=Panthera pardus TaxID=9691 RepID=A0A9W2VSF0_PANPR|nr:uncharacterized protein LOC128777792 [Panthera pardus]
MISRKPEPSHRLQTLFYSNCSPVTLKRLRPKGLSPPAFLPTAPGGGAALGGRVSACQSHRPRLHPLPPLFLSPPRPARCRSASPEDLAFSCLLPSPSWPCPRVPDLAPCPSTAAPKPPSRHQRQREGALTLLHTQSARPAPRPASAPGPASPRSGPFSSPSSVTGVSFPGSPRKRALSSRLRPARPDAAPRETAGALGVPATRSALRAAEAQSWGRPTPTPRKPDDPPGADQGGQDRRSPSSRLPPPLTPCSRPTSNRRHLPPAESADPAPPGS